MRKLEKFKGLIAAPYTPFKQNGDLNSEVIPRYARKLKAEKLTGSFVCGTTGEGMLLTTEERKKVAESWIAEQNDDFKVIVHVGTTSVMESRFLAEHAQKMGAYAIGCMGPLFLKPLQLNELVLFCKEVASAAPELPFYYYHIPSVSGINFSMSVFIEKASAAIPGFAGIKFTDNNFGEIQKCLNMDEGKWDVLLGYDEMLLAGLTIGVKSAVGSTYNFAAPLYSKIIKEFQSGKIESARALQWQSVKLVDVLSRYGGPIVAGKAVMKFQGIDCGKCRLPLPEISKKEEDELKIDLMDLSFPLF